MRPITGSVSSGGASVPGIELSALSGSFVSGQSEGHVASTGTSFMRNIKFNFNSGLLGPNYAGTETAGKHVYGPKIIYLGMEA
jgi:hypothetical protein